MKAPSIHRRRRAPMSEQRRLECLAAIDKALALNWPTGYVLRVVAEWKTSVPSQRAAQANRERMVRNDHSTGVPGIAYRMGATCQ